ncbi:MAG: hypothetical protein ACOYWZ_05785 [Bacillota bacterium]
MDEPQEFNLSEETPSDEVIIDNNTGFRETVENLTCSSEMLKYN